MYDPSKHPSDNARLFSGLYAGKQGFRPWDGANVGRALATPYQKPKILRIWPTIFG